MPHQCTSCGRVFEDGSKEMLSGCPDCGGNKFQFKPAGAIDGSDGGGTGPETATTPKKAPEDSPSTDASETKGTRRDRKPTPSESRGDDRASAVNRAAATVRDWVGRDDTDHGRSNDGPAEPDGTVDPVHEDAAQASARTDVVSKSELPDDPPKNSQTATTDSQTIQSNSEATDDSRTPADGYGEVNVVDAPANENPGLKELREELNSQFESIRIVNPGQYELNLMELYEREEYIISLQEDGKYVIEVPDAWDAVDR